MSLLSISLPVEGPGLVGGGGAGRLEVEGPAVGLGGGGWSGAGLGGGGLGGGGRGGGGAAPAASTALAPLSQVLWVSALF